MSVDVRIKQQIDQYKADVPMHAPSDISFYYRSKFTRQQFRSIFPQATTHLEFYANEMIKSLTQTNDRRLLSIGSGDGLIEIGVAKEIIKKHQGYFSFDLTELSPIQLERAKKNVEAAGLVKHFHYYEVDLNKWTPNKKYAGVMAHHSLHHIENLEGLFDGIKSCLLGSFVTSDMIGRNGHMRWPEVLELVKLFWNIIPVEKRKHMSLPNFEKEYYNWDCSKIGFEGIRAQDILPLCCERFGFTGFFAMGGLIDPFVGRGFGRHWNEKVEWDKNFIDLVGTLNEILLDIGYITPTQMSAVMVADKTVVPRVYKNRTPQNCIRFPDLEPKKE